MASITNERPPKHIQDQRGRDIAALVRLLVYAEQEAKRLNLTTTPDDIHAALGSIASSESEAVETYILS